MQQMLGVSFQNTHIKHSSLSDVPLSDVPLSDVPRSEKFNGGKGQDIQKVDFNQIFNRQVTAVKEKEIAAVGSEEINQNRLINGENFPVELSEISNQLSEFESLEELKKEIEARGFSSKFFDVVLDAQNNIEIQATNDEDLQNASMQNYSSILVMQINVDQKQVGSANELPLELNIDDTTNQAAQENPLNNEMNFYPELKAVDLQELSAILNKVGTDNANVKQSSNTNVALVVINDNQQQASVDSDFKSLDLINNTLLDEVMPAHVSVQLLSQAMLPKSESELTAEFLKTTGVAKEGVKDDSKEGFNNLDMDEQETLETQDSSQYEELESELESNELESQDPVKTKRAIQLDMLGGDKSITAKPGQIELPAINLSDAKASTNTIKSIPTAAADLMQAILPEKHAVKLSEELGSRVMMLHNQKMTTGFIRLDPPELGALEIKIETKGDEARVTIVTSQLNVKEALDSQSSRLREMLQDQGFTSVEVDVKEQDQSQTEQGESNSKDRGDLDAEDTENEQPTTQQKSVHLLDQFV